MQRLKLALSCALLASLMAAALQGYLLLRAATEIMQALPGDVSRELDQARYLIADQLVGARGDLAAQIEGARMDLLDRTERQVAGIRADALSVVRQSLTVADRRIGDSLARVDAALGEVKEIHSDLRPVLSNAAVLEQNYAALPDRVAATLQPSWLAIEPEITCRHADGSGYGGCWHSRVTGLFGEAERVGGVFTQKFPAMADAFASGAQSGAGILAIGQRAAKKYIDPHPMHAWDYFKAAGKVTLGLGVAGLRGGAF